MLTLANDSRFKMGMVLDGWLFPIKDEDLAEQVKQPVLFINTGSTFEVIFLK
jgi:platelet-activating factor acetylhydrolase